MTAQPPFAIQQSAIQQSAIHRVLGDAFDQLPAVLRRSHDARGRLTLSGEAEIEVCLGVFGRLLCRLVGLPRAGRCQPVTVTFTIGPDGREAWTRDFAGRCYHSRFAAGAGRHRGQLVERLGPLAIRYRLLAGPDRLSLDMVGAALLGVPLPRWLAPTCQAHECERDGAFAFDIVIGLPLLGRMIAYRGVLR